MLLLLVIWLSLCATSQADDLIMKTETSINVKSKLYNLIIN